jgi:LysR family transcriptional regulator, transcription activator of glutamate synthase operon
MDVRQLRYVVALAEEGSFTRAAERCNVAQPAMSQQIRRLEAELGVRLFDRTTRRVSVTDAGVALVSRARRVLAEVQDALDDVGDLRDGGTGSFTVGVTATPGPVDIVGLFATYHRQHPGVRLAVRERLSHEVVADVARDEVHIGIVSGQVSVATGVEVVDLRSEPLVALVPSEHPLAGCEQLRMADLDGESLIGFPAGATIRRSLDDAASRAGFAPRVAFETRELARARALTSAGLGISVVPSSDAMAPGVPVSVVPFDDPALMHHVSMCRRRNRLLSPAAEAFWRLAADSRP